MFEDSKCICMTWSQTCVWLWLKSCFFQWAFPGPGAGAMAAVFFGPFEKNLGSIRVRPPVQRFLGVSVALQLCFVSWLFIEFSAQLQRVSFPQCSPLRELRQAFLPISQVKRLNRKMAHWPAGDKNLGDPIPKSELFQLHNFICQCSDLAVLQYILRARMFFGARSQLFMMACKFLLTPSQPLQLPGTHSLLTSSRPADFHMLKILFSPLQWLHFIFPLCRMPLSPWSGELLFFPPGINQIQHTLCLGNFKSLNFLGCGGQCPPEEAVKVRANGPWEDYVQRGCRDVSNREERTRLCQSPPWTWIGHTTGQGQEGRTSSFLPRMSGWLGSGWDAVVGPSRTNVLQTNSSTSVS